MSERLALFDITDMLAAAVYPHPTDNIELIETHISWIILTGRLAYKIKKPVDFGFLDFSTLAKRHKYCQQELHLNRRLAPAIYRDIVEINRSPQGISVSGGGDIIEYAVSMLQFPQYAQLDNMSSAGYLYPDHMDAFAHMVSGFHQNIPVAGKDTSYGDDRSVYQPVQENFIQIEQQHIDYSSYADTLSQIKRWCREQIERLIPVIHQRKSNGFIRECHGDMHLRNLLWIDGQPMAFDCIEFNADLRWIDVVSEIAFLMMDLQYRAQHTLANRFINTYLEDTGDYEGLYLLPFYLCYRAMVRAKVCSLRAGQAHIAVAEKNEILTEFRSYIELAEQYTVKRDPTLNIMRGMSASGKSTISQQLVDATGAIRIRSDIERKRLFGFATTDRLTTTIDSGIYSDRASRQTYNRLAELAENMIDAGYTVIIDAAFLKKQQLDLFQKLADRMQTPFTIIEVTASPDTLRQRIRERKDDISDADITVLEHQLANWEPVEETPCLIRVDTEQNVDIDRLSRIITLSN